MKHKLIIFAFGTSNPDKGGTGAKNLAENVDAHVIALVSGYEFGGVRQRADSLGLPFFYFPGPYTAKGYQELVQRICEVGGIVESDLWYALSGWFKKVYWLSPARTFNIHPASLPRFGGKGMFGEKLHALVWEAYQNGEITQGEIVMHFVTERYDEGPIFFRHSFSLYDIETYEEYREHVRSLEHYFQPIQTNLVLRGEILWDGLDPKTLRVGSK